MRARRCNFNGSAFAGVGSRRAKRGLLAAAAAEKTVALLEHSQMGQVGAGSTSSTSLASRSLCCSSKPV